MGIAAAPYGACRFQLQDIRVDAQDVIHCAVDLGTKSFCGTPTS
jgi:hypothetical protein